MTQHDRIRRPWRGRLGCAAAMTLAIASGALAMPAHATVQRAGTSLPAIPSIPRIPAIPASEHEAASFSNGSVEQNGVLELEALGGVSSNDLWLVGARYFGSSAVTLTWHYDGSRWTQVADPATNFPILDDVAAVASNDVWAVGQQTTPGDNGTANLIEHWDGTAWSVITSPQPSGQYLYLDKVSAISANQVDASGLVCESGEGPCAAEVLRWDGTDWSVVSQPPESLLTKTTATAGGKGMGIGANGQHSYSARWDGSQWREVSVPETQYGDALNDTSGAADGSAWAVGFQRDAAGRQAGGEILHWSGGQWSQVDGSADVSSYDDVSSDAPGDAWVTGGSDSEHWDGTAFHQVRNPFQRTQGVIDDVAAFAPDDAWMVGSFSGAAGQVTIFAHYDGTKWNIQRKIGRARSSSTADVSATSPSDVWSVGSTSTTFLHAHSRISHFDGTTWQPVGHPDPGKFSTSLLGDDARTADDAWAVGSRSDSEYTARTLIEHWDGSSWSTVPSRSLDVDQSWLTGVSADTATDAWAVGQSETRYGQEQNAIAEHWDGNAWALVPVPAGITALRSVAAVSPTDAWATAEGLLVNGQRKKTYVSDVLHWDGTSWSVALEEVHTDTTGYGLADVVATAGNDVWAVGVLAHFHGGGKPAQTLVLHWDGSTWSTVKTPQQPQSGFRAASSDGQGGLWAVGTESKNSQSNVLIEHWDGTRWRVSDVTAKPGSSLVGVTAGAADDAWAVGSSGDNPLALHWNGTAWR